MPYLNLDIDYFTNRKTSRLIGLLGRGAAELPIRLWAYCGKHHPESGSLTGYSAQEIESVVGWWGGSGKMVEAMVSVGFLEKTETGYQVHDWLEHAGHLAAFKKRARAAAKKRWDKYASSNAQEGFTNAPSLPNLLNPPLFPQNNGGKAGGGELETKKHQDPNPAEAWEIVQKSFEDMHLRKSLNGAIRRTINAMGGDEEIRYAFKEKPVIIRGQFLQLYRDFQGNGSTSN